MKKVLIADYDVKQVAHLKALLEGQGFEVSAAHNGEEAIQMFQSWEPDAVILEPMLPKLHGFEVSKKIKASARSETPLIWCTKTYKGKKYRDEAAYKYQVAAFIERPADDAVILNALAKVLGIVLKSAAPPAASSAPAPFGGAQAPGPTPSQTLAVDRAALLREIARLGEEAEAASSAPQPAPPAEPEPPAPAHTVPSSTPHRKQDMAKMKEALKSTLSSLKKTPKKKTASPYGLKKTVVASAAFEEELEEAEEAPPPPPKPASLPSGQASGNLLTSEDLFSDMLEDTPSPSAIPAAVEAAEPLESEDIAGLAEAESPEETEEGTFDFTGETDGAAAVSSREEEEPAEIEEMEGAGPLPSEEADDVPSLESLDALEEAVEEGADAENEGGDSLFTQSDDGEEFSLVGEEPEDAPSHRVVDVARDGGEDAPSLEALDAMENAVEGGGLSDDLFSGDDEEREDDLYATQRVEVPMEEAGVTLALDEILGKGGQTPEEAAPSDEENEEAFELPDVPDAEEIAEDMPSPEGGQASPVLDEDAPEISSPADEVNEDLLDTGAGMDAEAFALPDAEEEGALLAQDATEEVMEPAESLPAEESESIAEDAVEDLEAEPDAAPTGAVGDDSTLTVERDEFMENMKRQASSFDLDEPPDVENEEAALEEGAPESFELDEAPAPQARSAEQGARNEEDSSVPSSVFRVPSSETGAALDASGDLSFVEDEAAHAMEDLETAHSINLDEEDVPQARSTEQETQNEEDSSVPSSKAEEGPSRAARDEATHSMEDLETAHSVDLDRADSPAPQTRSMEQGARSEESSSSAPSSAFRVPRSETPPPPAPHAAETPAVRKPERPVPAKASPSPTPAPTKAAGGGMWKIAAGVAVVTLLGAGVYFMFMKKDSTPPPAEAAPAPVPAKAAAPKETLPDQKASVVRSTTPPVPAGVPVAPGSQVFVIVTVAPDGSVGDARLAHNPSGEDALAQAALTEVRGWAFSPARRDGEAISEAITVTVRFTGE